MTGTLAKRIDRLDKNYLMNGAFDFWQRGGVSGTINTSTSLVYQSADKWRMSHTGTFTGTPAIGRDPTAPDAAYPYVAKHTFRRNASAATLTYEQRIESNISSELAVAGFASFSIQSIPLVAGTIRLTILTPTVIDDHTSQTQNYQSSVAVTAGVWNDVMFPAIPMPAAANLGLAVRIEYILPSATDGSVQSFYWSRAMLNAGKQCSTFQRYGGSYDRELLGVQRYVEKSYDLDVNPGTNAAAGGRQTTHQAVTGTGFVQVTFGLCVRKRLNSGITATVYSQNGASGNIQLDNATNLAASIGANATTYNISYTNTAGRYGNLHHFFVECDL